MRFVIAQAKNNDTTKENSLKQAVMLQTNNF